MNEINWQAAQLARQAAKGAFVAGSVGPLGISSAEAEHQGVDRECFQTQIGALLEGGVDLIFPERFQDVDELLVALHVKQSLHHCPAICSLAPGEDGLLPGKVSLEVAFEKLVRHDAEIFGLSCTTGAEVALLLVERLMPSELALAVYPNARLPGSFMIATTMTCLPKHSPGWVSPWQNGGASSVDVAAPRQPTSLL